MQVGAVPLNVTLCAHEMSRFADAACGDEASTSCLSQTRPRHLGDQTVFAVLTAGVVSETWTKFTAITSFPAGMSCRDWPTD
jgi:hypothetical protein